MRKPCKTLLSLYYLLMKKPKHSKLNFKFIEEKPKNDQNKLSYGHLEIVSTLEDIIDKSPESFTIGLYGNWGTGKSSISESLQAKLKEKKIPLIIFDVWKHEGDALRRTFLIELNQKLDKEYDDSIYKKIDLSENIYNNTKESKSLGIRIPWKKILIYSLFVMGIIIPVFILFLLLYVPVLRFYDIVEDEYSAVLEFIKLSFAALVTGLVSFKFISSFVEEIKVEKTKEKFQDPIEFENQFKEILNNGLKVEKLVIVFDNLDRVSGDKAVEIISTIKTFLTSVDIELKKRDVVFIIPCDADAIKRHLQKSLGYNENTSDFHNYADEYLRKFFNTIIWIPSFFDVELQKDTYEKLKETSIIEFNNEDLAGLIVYGFDQNPRQIIQFINTLISNYILFKKYQNKYNFRIENDVIQLAKYLLLIHKFPEIMSLFKNEFIYSLSEGLKHLKDNNSKKSEVEAEKNDVRIIEFEKFLSKTEGWKIDSLELFYKFRKSEVENIFENSERLVKIIESNRAKKIFKNQENSDDTGDKKYLDELNLNEEVKQKSFNKLIHHKIKNNQSPTVFYQIINSFLEITKAYDIKITWEVCNELRVYLEKEKFVQTIINIDVKNIESELFLKSKELPNLNQIRNIITKQWVTDLKEFVYSSVENETTDELIYIANVLELLIEQPKYFKYNEFFILKEMLKEKYFRLSNYYCNVNEKYNNYDLIYNISKDEEHIKNLLSSELINQVLEIEKNDTSSSYEGKLKLVTSFLSYKGKFEESTNYLLVPFIYEVLKKCNIQSEGENEVEDIKQKKDELVLFTYPLFEKVIQQFTIESPNDNPNFAAHKDEFVSLFKHIKSWFSQETYKSSALYFNYLYLYEKVYRDTFTNHGYYNKSDIIAIISEFIRTQQPEKILETIGEQIFQKFIDDNAHYLDSVINRLHNDAGLYSYFFKYLNPENKQNAVTFWIDKPSAGILNVVKQIGDEIPNKAQIGNMILGKLNAMGEGGVEDQKNFLQTLFLLNIGEGEDFHYDSYKRYIELRLLHQNERLRQLAFDEIGNKRRNIFSKDEKVDMVKSAFEKYFENINHYHTSMQPLFDLDIKLKSENFDTIFTDLKINHVSDLFFKLGSLTFLEKLFTSVSSELKLKLLNALIHKLTPQLNSDPSLKSKFFESIKIIYNSLPISDYDTFKTSTKLILKALLADPIHLESVESAIEVYIKHLQNNISFNSIDGRLYELYSSDVFDINKLNRLFVKSTKSITIVSASYETQERSIDVKDALGEKISNNFLAVKADNNLKEDPHHGVSKVLKLKYKIGTKPYEKEYKENEWVIIPEPKSIFKN
jgi:hypothetical protein